MKDLLKIGGVFLAGYFVGYYEMRYKAMMACAEGLLKSIKENEEKEG